ncbi:MAG: beta-lactamase family protein [Candidatus Tectomicrobia bacterium]|nr:beta-lactamase family protein [Candidatus Tectomicrobia bacterium]
MIRRALLLVGIVLLASLLLSRCPAPQDKAKGVRGGGGFATALEDMIARQMRKTETVGLSLALLSDDELIYAQGFGYADRQKQVRARAETIYYVGSLSKSVTAALILRLVEAGRVDLEQRLGAYLPEFAIAGAREQVTVTSVLGHHSGLPNVWRHIDGNGGPARHDQLARGLADARLLFRPGRVTKYSSLGYNLLGHVVERVSGERFEDHAQTTLFAQLGMSRASFEQPPRGARQLSRGYRAGKAVARLPDLRGEIPAGGLTASVIDLVRFARPYFGDGRSLDGRAVFTPQSVQRALKPAAREPIPLDFDERMGLGFSLSSSSRYRRFGFHALMGGSTYPFHCVLVILPPARMAAAACANSEESGPVVERAVEGALEALYERKGLDDETAAAGQRRAPSGLLRLDDATADLLATFSGAYQTKVGMVNIAFGAHLEATQLGRRMRLRRLSDEGWWGSPRYLLLGSIPLKIGALESWRFSFAEIDGQRMIAMKRNDGYWQRFGERVEPVPIPDAWRARVGDYNLVNAPDAEVNFARTPHASFVVENGFMILRLHLRVPNPMQLDWIVLPVDDERAVFAGLSDHLGGEALRANGRKSFSYSGYRFVADRSD